MKFRRFSAQIALAYTFLIATWNMAGQNAAAELSPVSQWQTLINKAGWSIKYPRNWHVSSCRTCSDPTDPDVFVVLQDAASKELIMIEHLIDKPANQNVPYWLDHIKVTTNLNPRMSEEWISMNGTPALKVITRDSNSTESENVYIVHGSKTFAIRADRNACQVCRRILSTFKFTNP